MAGRSRTVGIIEGEALYSEWYSADFLRGDIEPLENSQADVCLPSADCSKSVAEKTLVRLAANERLNSKWA